MVILATELARKVLPGNSVILDLGDGNYARYAHFQPGSIRVKEGALCMLVLEPAAALEDDIERDGD
jgi:hypothetical protein